MKTSNDIQAMRDLFNEGKLNLLTIEAAKSLKGKRIKTIYFGYCGQDGIDEFVVGDITNELDLASTQECEGYNNRAEYWKTFMSPQQLDEHKNQLTLLRADGTTTCMHYATEYDWDNTSAFWCSDTDRHVFYIECNENPLQNL